MYLVLHVRHVELGAACVSRVDESRLHPAGQDLSLYFILWFIGVLKDTARTVSVGNIHTWRSMHVQSYGWSLLLLFTECHELVVSEHASKAVWRCGLCSLNTGNMTAHVVRLCEIISLCTRIVFHAQIDSDEEAHQVILLRDLKGHDSAWSMWRCCIHLYTFVEGAWPHACAWTCHHSDHTDTTCVPLKGNCFRWAKVLHDYDQDERAGVLFVSWSGRCSM